MGLRGPQAKPERLRALGGYAGHHRPPNRREPVHAGPPPAAPKGLSRRARLEWKRVAPRLHRLGLLQAPDRALLAAYCETWAEWCDANELVKKEGLIVTTEQGTFTHPAVTIRRKAQDAMRQLANHFGLSPSTRARLEVPNSGDDGKKGPARFFGAA